MIDQFLARRRAGDPGSNSDIIERRTVVAEEVEHFGPVKRVMTSHHAALRWCSAVLFRSLDRSKARMSSIR
jgi:hypothetical protein